MSTVQMHTAFRSCVLLPIMMILMIAPGGSTVRIVPGAYATIQGAIDAAAAGDTIRIYSGTYTGQVNINKSLVVIGSWPDTATILAAPADFATNGAYNFTLDNFVNGRPIVHVGAATPIHVVLQGVVVDGLRRGPGFDQEVGYSGVLAEACSLAMRSSLIRNILPTDSLAHTYHTGKLYNGRGIEVRGNASVALIDSNTFQDINRFHILINATDTAYSQPSVFPVATVTNNTIVGKGMYNGGQKGVWFNHGAYGTIAQNVISNFDYTSAYIEPDRATGIALWMGDLNATGVTNVVRNVLTASTFINNKGIYAWGAHDTLSENVITGFRFGIELHNEQNPSVTRNQITGGAIGIMLGDESPVQDATITIGGALGDKNVISGQISPSAGGRAITLAYRDPMNHEELKSPYPVNATYNDFGVYTAAEISERIFDRADTSLAGIDTVLFKPFMVPGTRVGLKTFLQGSFTTTGDSMLNTLRTSGLLAAHFSGITVPDLAVDSVGIEIRDSLTRGGSQRIYFVPGWLFTNGAIHSFTDPAKEYIELPDSVSGDYYVVIRHRNHLGIMSSARVACEGSTTPSTYDFTTAQSQAYGTNSMVGVGTKLGMIAGDANLSTIVTAADANYLFGFMNSATYHNGDVNLSGIVTAADANMLYGNMNKATNVP